MTTILALDTSSQVCAIGLWVDGSLRSRQTSQARRAAQETLPIVNALLEESDCRLKDIDAIAVVTGPGSFTGIRVGLAMAQGLAFADDLPTVAVSALAAQAAYGLQRHPPASHALVCQAARQDKAYVGLYRGDDDLGVALIGSECLGSPDEVAVSLIGKEDVGSLGDLGTTLPGKESVSSPRELGDSLLSNEGAGHPDSLGETFLGMGSAGSPGESGSIRLPVGDGTIVIAENLSLARTFVPGSDVAVHAATPNPIEPTALLGYHYLRAGRAVAADELRANYMS